MPQSTLATLLPTLLQEKVLDLGASPEGELLMLWWTGRINTLGTILRIVYIL